MVIAEVLTPLRQRYASWLDLDDEQVSRDRQEDPDEIRAIQLLLRLERTATPSWHLALAQAASGCAHLCLDERSAPGGQWHEAVDDYVRGHIRKVTRRGRGAQWDATADLPGLSLSDGDTQVRVLVPGLVRELDKRVSKLQVGGTDLPVDAAPPSSSDGPLLTCFVPAQRELTAGKLMAQTGHAGMLTAALLAPDAPHTLTAWRDAGCPATVRAVPDVEWRQMLQTVRDPLPAWQNQQLVAVRDAGFTEVDPGTVTVIGQVA